MANNQRALNKKDFFALLAQRSGLSEKSVRRLYDQMVKLVAEELKLNGVINLPDLCKIIAKEKKGRDVVLPDKRITYVDSRLSLRITPKDYLKDVVNDRVIGKNTTKMLRRGGTPKSLVTISEFKNKRSPKDFSTALEEVLNCRTTVETQKELDGDWDAWGSDSDWED